VENRASKNDTEDLVLQEAQDRLNMQAVDVIIDRTDEKDAHEGKEDLILFI
jgi:hypothetical protein